jgi:putative ABC transport system substrate-binding protein
MDSERIGNRAFPLLFVLTVGLLSTAAATEHGIKKRVAMLTMRMDAEAQSEVQSIAVNRFAQHRFVQGSNLDLRVFNAETRELRERRARDAIAWKPELLICFGTNAARTAKSLTNVPIVFVDVSEPVRAGLVSSLNRPGGTATGTSGRSVDLLAKQVELLVEVAPNIKRIAVLTSTGSAPTAMQQLEQASRSLNVEVTEIKLSDEAGLEFVQAAVASSKANGVVIVGWVRFGEFEKRAIEYFKTARLPSAWPSSRQVEQGGLVSVGPPDADMLVRSIDIASRILTGESAASIPVDQITHVQVAVNLATARDLGLQVRDNVLLRADRIVK